MTFDAPEGLVTIDGENHHITKTARIGEIRPDGLIYTIWESPGPIEPATNRGLPGSFAVQASATRRAICAPARLMSRTAPSIS